MVTADRIREAWRAIVESHRADVAFVSIWAMPLDDKEGTHYPACVWRPLTTGTVTTEAHAIQDTFTVSMAFVDQTATDRGPDERDRAHDRMDAIARQCWYRFHELYVTSTGTVDGQTLDFTTDAAPTFTPVYDDGVHHLTGVTLQMTLTSNAPSYCLTSYFE